MSEDEYQLIKKKRKALRDACADLAQTLHCQEVDRGVYDYTSVVQIKQQRVTQLQAEYAAM